MSTVLTNSASSSVNLECSLFLMSVADLRSASFAATAFDVSAMRALRASISALAFSIAARKLAACPWPVLISN
jgi:hypothetical protein